jgi:Fur family transcriptional regulator, ferric uptake regulator
MQWRHRNGNNNNDNNNDVCTKHALLREQFVQAIESIGEVVLPEDLAIVDAVLNGARHCTVEHIRDEVAKRYPELSTAHTRRTLSLLCDLGIARQMEVGDSTVYEHIHLDEHHDHFICLRCGKVQEFVDPQIEERQHRWAEQIGFRPLFHRLEIRGLCRECGGGKTPVRTLADVSPGETVYVREVLGGHQFRMRLTEMGLTRGSAVRVTHVGGQIALDVRGTRVGVGRGIAGKILVAAQPPKHQEPPQEP